MPFSLMKDVHDLSRPSETYLLAFDFPLLVERKKMIQQVIFDNVELLTNDEKNSIILHHMNSSASIDELSKVLGIDQLIIQRFISNYQNRLRGA